MAQRTVVWFRRDLRLADNTALAAALARGGPIAPLFVLDPTLLRGRDRPREAWLLANLRALDARLGEAGARLIVRRGDPRVEVPRVAGEVGADAVHFNRDYTPLARRRDAGVERACQAAGLAVHSFADAVLVEPADLVTGAGTFYTVFTPYYRAWSARAIAAPPPAPRRIAMVDDGAGVTIPDGAWAGPLPPAGEAAARDALGQFVRHRLVDYAAHRDRMDLDGTARLSFYLRFGALSPRQVLAAVRKAPARTAGARDAAAAFLRELAWREFFTQILWHAPDTRTQPLRRERGDIAWRDDPEALAAWQEGRSGYPLVDAGMRQLAATGWMHNRARLVTASFLVKHLLLDWRAGDRWFMRCLLDGDPAVNGGNWQWVASIGADALPAFRIFNPVLQGKRFDPHGHYVRRWVPELADVDDRVVHEPWVTGGVAGYPAPIVEHERARRRALQVLGASVTRDSAASVREGAG